MRRTGVKLNVGTEVIVTEIGGLHGLDVLRHAGEPVLQGCEFGLLGGSEWSIDFAKSLSSSSKTRRSATSGRHGLDDLGGITRHDGLNPSKCP